MLDEMRSGLPTSSYSETRALLIIPGIGLPFRLSCADIENGPCVQRVGKMKDESPIRAQLRLKIAPS
jgi:hypothetical protein